MTFISFHFKCLKSVFGHRVSLNQHHTSHFSLVEQDTEGKTHHGSKCYTQFFHQCCVHRVNQYEGLFLKRLIAGFI